MRAECKEADRSLLWPTRGERSTACLLIVNPLFCFLFFHKLLACLVLWPTEAKRLRSLGTWGEGAWGDPESEKALSAQRREKLLSPTCSWAAAWKMPVSATTCPDYRV